MSSKLTYVEICQPVGFRIRADSKASAVISVNHADLDEHSCSIVRVGRYCDRKSISQHGSRKSKAVLLICNSLLCLRFASIGLESRSIDIHRTIGDSQGLCSLRVRVSSLSLLIGIADIYRKVMRINIPAKPLTNQRSVATNHHFHKDGRSIAKTIKIQLIAVSIEAETSMFPLPDTFRVAFPAFTVTWLASASLSVSNTPIPLPSKVMTPS